MKKPIETLTNHLWHQLDTHLTNLHLQWLSSVYPWILNRSNIQHPPTASHVRHLRHLGRTPQRRWKQLGEELCLPASVLQGYQPRQPRQPGCLSKQYICTFHSGYESRICKWFVTCCYSCFFRCESSSESIQASNLEGERMIWSHIESSYQRYGEFQGNLPGSVCCLLGSKPDPCVFCCF